jgi:hypothetical protein
MNEGLVVLTWRCPVCPKEGTLSALTVGELRHRIFNHIFSAHTHLTDNQEIINSVNEKLNAALSERRESSDENPSGYFEAPMTPEDRKLMKDLKVLW